MADLIGYGILLKMLDIANPSPVFFRSLGPLRYILKNKIMTSDAELDKCLYFGARTFVHSKELGRTRVYRHFVFNGFSFTNFLLFRCEMPLLQYL